MSCNTPATGANGRQPRARAAWVAALAIVGAVAGCAPPAPPLSEVPVAIDYEWPAPPQPLDNSTATPKPDGVVIRWKPGAFSAADIEGIAGEQCGLYHLAARAKGPPLRTAPLLTQDFACVAQGADAGG
jgi:hypothetical protein